MKKSNKRKREDRIFTLVLIIFCLSFAFFISRMAVSDIDYDGVCKNKYGENYIYEYDADFGRYCIELNYENLTKINPKPFNWTQKEMKEMCDTPKFFELKRWDKGIC